MKPRPLSRNRLASSCVIATLMVFSAGAHAQAPGPEDMNEHFNPRVASEPSEVRVTGARVPEWGTSSTNILKLGSGSFTPGLSGWTWSQAYFWRWATTGGFTYWDASFHLPSGTKINSMAVEAYDNSASGDIWVSFATCPDLTGTCSFVVGSTSGTPGYTWLTVFFSPPITIDNNLNSYHVRVRLDSGDSNNAFRGVAFNYQLQVSPAPGVASFTDVPTSYWAFQYIEALKASGITQGVTPTTFEPESNVTRAQMAVFLAKALGLHWPN